MWPKEISIHFTCPVLFFHTEILQLLFFAFFWCFISSIIVTIICIFVLIVRDLLTRIKSRSQYLGKMKTFLLSVLTKRQDRAGGSRKPSVPVSHFSQVLIISLFYFDLLWPEEKEEEEIFLSGFLILRFVFRADFTIEEKWFYYGELKCILIFIFIYDIMMVDGMEEIDD